MSDFVQETRYVFPSRSDDAWAAQDSDPVGDILAAAERLSGRIDPDDILLTVQEVAEILRLSPKTTERYMRNGSVPGFQIEGRWRCHRASLRSWIRDQEVVQDG